LQDIGIVRINWKKMALEGEEWGEIIEATPACSNLQNYS
jgi:hypothetical protein